MKNTKFRILFVCLGNICRSPAAEGVMKALLEKENLSDVVEVDSAGTSGWHIGELPDHRMRQAASRRGYVLNSRARKVKAPEDFDKFDMIIAMDDENMRDLKALDRDGKYAHKLFKMTDFCQKYQADEVPDPYYGGYSGFENVLDLLEDACNGLLATIKPKLQKKS